MINVTRLQIPGMETKKPRRLYVCTPEDYGKTDKRYPVLYMFDGHNVFYNSHATYGRSWGMREYLKKAKPELLIVAVECNPEGNNRISEYSPWDIRAPRMGLIKGRGRETMEWIVNVLKPMIDAQYRSIPDREHTMIAGSSLGGLMTLFAVAEYNSVFSGGAALSPSLWVSPRGMAETIGRRPFEKPTRVYTDLGSAEDGKEDPRELAGLFRTALQLTKAGAHVFAQIVPGALHNEEAWEKRIPLFMDYLLKP